MILVNVVIFAAAITASIIRRKHYPSFQDWWNAEGCAIWIIAAVIGGGLLITR